MLQLLDLGTLRVWKGAVIHKVSQDIVSGGTKLILSEAISK